MAVTRFLDTTDPAPIGAKEDKVMGERVTRRPRSREDLDLPMLPSRAMVTKYPQRHEIWEAHRVARHVTITRFPCREAITDLLETKTESWTAFGRNQKQTGVLHLRSRRSGLHEAPVRKRVVDLYNLVSRARQDELYKWCSNLEKNCRQHLFFLLKAKIW